MALNFLLKCFPFLATLVYYVPHEYFPKMAKKVTTVTNGSLSKMVQLYNQIKVPHCIGLFIVMIWSKYYHQMLQIALQSLSCSKMEIVFFYRQHGPPPLISATTLATQCPSSWLQHIAESSSGCVLHLIAIIIIIL